MKEKEFKSLSDKRQIHELGHYDYPEEDVKEFIRRITELSFWSGSDYNEYDVIVRRIKKLAGEELTK